jgi:hypothetical protein
MPRGQNLRGHAKHPNSGRKKGSRNRVTLELKHMIEGALAEVGGQAYLVSLAKKRPEVFVPLLAKLLPKETQLSGSLNYHIDFRERLEAARQRVAARISRDPNQQEAVPPEQVC